MFWPPVYHAVAGIVMLATGPGVLGARVTMGAILALLLAGCFYLGLRRTRRL
ncbi:MAG: hypothetical protein R3B90_22040 [Planctomycetaceae bacterium]